MRIFKVVLPLVLVLSFVVLAIGCPGNYGGAYGPTGRAATITIAAPDSTPLEKSQADYICGTNASTTWTTAIAAAPTYGCGILAYSGTYNFVASVNLTKAISIRGQGYNTYFKFNGSSAVFITGSDNCSFEDLRVDNGGIDFGAMTGWMVQNVVVGSTYYAFKDAGITITGNTFSAPIDASNISSGLIATGRLGTGTADSTNFLAGNGVWTPLISTQNTTAKTLDTVYQNTYSKVLFVQVDIVFSSAGTCNANVGVTSSPSTTVARVKIGWEPYHSGDVLSLTFIVLPGYYYKVTGSAVASVSIWAEWY